MISVKIIILQGKKDLNAKYVKFVIQDNKKIISTVNYKNAATKGKKNNKFLQRMPIMS